MADEERTVRDLIRRFTAEDEQALDSAPTNDELRAYLAGELSEPQKDELREHLSKDRQATRALLELTMEQTADAGSVLTPEQRRADRDALRARIAADVEDQAAKALEMAAVATLVAKLRRTRHLAIVVGVACFGLLGWHLASSMTMDQGPEAVEVIADLFLRPVDGTERGDDGLERLGITSDQRHVYLSLTAIAITVPEQVRLVIRAQDDPQPSIEHSGLATSGKFPLRLRLDADQLPRGRVYLVLYSEPGADLIAEYQLEVEDD